MGDRGPVPKRSDQRRRTNKPEDGLEVTKAPAAESVPVPEGDPQWHPIARDWFDSLAKSGQAVFYEPSDWATARYVADAMSRNLSTGRFSAQLFAAVMAASTTLLVTEGDRRRVRLELARAPAGPDAAELTAATDLDAYRSRISG